MELCIGDPGGVLHGPESRSWVAEAAFAGEAGNVELLATEKYATLSVSGFSNKTNIKGSISLGYT